MPARFWLDGKGRLTPEGDDGAQAIGRATGHFELWPTAPDLLCFVRTPPAGGRRQTPRVTLAGDASAFPIPDLIAFLSQSRWSGVIRVHAPGGERSISLKDGEVRGASSDDPADRLGEVLVRLGHVQRAHLEEVLREHPPSKVGRALVDRGMLAAHDLYRCVTQQVADIFHAMVLCREGAFLLVEQELDEKTGNSLELSTQSLLMDAIRKIDEMAHFRNRIPHGRLYVTRKRETDGKLEPEEQGVLAAVDGRRTVLELGQRLKLSEFDVTKVIFRLLEGGYVGVSDRPQTLEMPAVTVGGPGPNAPASAPARASELDPREVLRVFNFIFKEILGEVERQGMSKEFLAHANAALAKQGLSTSPVLRGVTFERDGSLPEEEVLAGLNLTDDPSTDPAHTLRQVLSDVMFFLLFQAGELLEARADEDLNRRVKELLATLGS
jgi:hypothetical protein